MRPLRHRTSVDLPEPESPMTTKTQPLGTSKLTSRTAATQPVRASSSARGRSASAESTMRSGCGPNTFQTPRHEIVGVSVKVEAVPVVMRSRLLPSAPDLGDDRGNDLVQVADHRVVGLGNHGRIAIGVDGQNVLCRLHTHPVLYGAGD